MRSLRLDTELDRRVRKAATLEGVSISEFLRQAASERAERALSLNSAEQLGDVVGSVRGGGGRARETGTAFADLLAEQRHSK